MAKKYSKYSIYSIAVPAIMFIVFLSLHQYFMSLFWVSLPVFAVFLGILFGIIGMKEISESKELKGRLLALFGIFGWYILIVANFVKDLI